MKFKCFLAFLMMICLTLAFTSSVIADCPLPEHQLIDSMTKKYSVLSHYIQAGHVYNDVLEQICSKCGYIERLIVGSSITPHDFSDYVRKGNHAGIGYHEVIYGCTDPNCPYTTVVLVECSGPPCEMCIERTPLPEAEPADCEEDECA